MNEEKTPQQFKNSAGRVVDENGSRDTSVARLPRDRAPFDDDDDQSSSSEEDDDLLLEGVLVRNPEVSSSSDEYEDETDSDEREEKKPPAKKQKTTRNTTQGKQQKKQEKKRKSKNREPDIVQVNFTFHDMAEKFFHGLKTLLHSSSPLFAAHSSALSDLMIDNVSVGTVVSTEGDTDANVFGFASVLNVTTYQDKPCIQFLKEFCLQSCPSDRREELTIVLGGKTKRPAGFLLQSRMVNLPLELVEILHQQLVLDMDWAVKNAEGGEVERKSLDFGVFIRCAPATKGTHGSIDYKFFEDEMFASNADLTFTIDAPKSTSATDRVKPLVSVIVMTKSGHREALKDLAKLVNG